MLGHGPLLSPCDVQTLALMTPLERARARARSRRMVSTVARLASSLPTSWAAR